MSGLLVNILRRSRFYASYRKTLDLSSPATFLSRDLWTSIDLLQKSDDKEKPTDDDKKKKKESIKITLLGKDNSMTVTSLEEAQKLSRRRDMKLVKVQDFDAKTQRAVYKLLSAAELLVEEGTAKKSSPSSKKHEKLLTIGSRIEEHDLASRIKNVTKWLQKENDVRILIHGSTENDPGLERIFKAIEVAVKEINGRIVQKANKGGNMRFTILPPSAKASSSGDKTS